MKESQVITALGSLAHEIRLRIIRQLIVTGSDGLSAGVIGASGAWESDAGHLNPGLSKHCLPSRQSASRTTAAVSTEWLLRQQPRNPCLLF